MDLLIMLLEYIGVIWVALVIIMLPVYFIKRKVKPQDEKNTIKSLLVKSLIASAIFTLIFCSGLIAMYMDDLKGAATVHAAEVSAEVSDEDVEPKLIFIKETDKVKAGKSFTFKVDTGNITNEVVWAVSKESYATINDNGKLTGKKAGKITVTATVGELSVSKKVTIEPKKIVALDPGHSGVVAGGVEPIGPGSKTMKAKDASGTCGTVTKIPEYKLTMNLAKKMKKLLENKGYKVVMTRTNNNKAISCIERAQVANKAKADIFIRIHADGSSSSSVSGASALYPTPRNPYIKKLSAKSKKLSSCVLNEMCKNAKASNRGLSGRDDLTGTNWAKMPVTLIEVGFMTNPTEDRLLSMNDYQDKLAAGMVKGIDKYFGYKQ